MLVSDESALVSSPCNNRVKERLATYCLSKVVVEVGNQIGDREDIAEHPLLECLRLQVVKGL